MPVTTKKERVLVALSGGVDSSVCVHLLQQQGYEVAGAVLDLSEPHKDAVEAAQKAADFFGIQLFVISEHELFNEKVIQPFIQSYRSGQTPNPCIFCNPAVKFALILQCADQNGFDKIATGHYAGIEEKDGRWLLKKSSCVERDQSYMLYRLSQPQLARILFPLADIPKPQVRSIALEIGLFCANKPDSQEICFIPDNDYAGYIERLTGKMPEGDFISPEGKVCGRHKGLLHYTVGQRKGLGIALGKPVFVREIDPVTNNIKLAYSGGEYTKSIQVAETNFIAINPPKEAFRADVKIRSMATPIGALISPLPDDVWHVEFDQPQRMPAKGQSAVWYHDDIVIGGGYIVG